MKDRLYNIMSDLEEIIKQIEDMKNILEVHSSVPCDENNLEKLKSILNVQIRLLEKTKEAGSQLHIKIDETILDIIHNRL